MWLRGRALHIILVRHYERREFIVSARETVHKRKNLYSLPEKPHERRNFFSTPEKPRETVHVFLKRSNFGITVSLRVSDFSESVLVST